MVRKSLRKGSRERRGIEIAGGPRALGAIGC
jgi:hypothetical protein